MYKIQDCTVIAPLGSEIYLVIQETGSAYVIHKYVNIPTPNMIDAASKLFSSLFSIMAEPDTKRRLLLPYNV